VVVLSLVLLTLGRHAGEIAASAKTSLSGVELFSSFSLAMIAVLWAYEGMAVRYVQRREVVEPQKVFSAGVLAGLAALNGIVCGGGGGLSGRTGPGARE
jgi:hypothetical protein